MNFLTQYSDTVFIRHSGVFMKTNFLANCPLVLFTLLAAAGCGKIAKNEAISAPKSSVAKTAEKEVNSERDSGDVEEKPTQLSQIKQLSIAPGEVCKAGGKKLVTCVDTALPSVECTKDDNNFQEIPLCNGISSEQTIVNGADGKDGSAGKNGFSALAITEDEPAGNTCMNGGRIFFCAPIPPPLSARVPLQIWSSKNALFATA